MDTAMIYEDMPQETSVSKVGIDSSQFALVSPQKTDATSALDLSINPFYDAGYVQGQEDGYYDGIENIRGDSYDDACRYKGKKRKEYELGYEEYFYGDGVCVIEWADLIEELLPEHTIRIEIQYGENEGERIYRCTC